MIRYLNDPLPFPLSERKFHPTVDGWIAPVRPCARVTSEHRDAAWIRDDEDDANDDDDDDPYGDGFFVTIP